MAGGMPTQNLVAWLKYLLNKNSEGIKWFDEGDGVFGIEWNHCGREGWSIETDGQILQAYAIYSNSNAHPTDLKRNLRCALNRTVEKKKLEYLKDYKPSQSDHKKCRFYRFPNEGGTKRKNDSGEFQQTTNHQPQNNLLVSPKYIENTPIPTFVEDEKVSSAELADSTNDEHECSPPAGTSTQCTRPKEHVSANAKPPMKRTKTGKELDDTWLPGEPLENFHADYVPANIVQSAQPMYATPAQLLNNVNNTLIQQAQPLVLDMPVCNVQGDPDVLHQQQGIQLNVNISAARADLITPDNNVGREGARPLFNNPPYASQPSFNTIQTTPNEQRPTGTENGGVVQSSDKNPNFGMQYRDNYDYATINMQELSDFQFEYASQGAYNISHTAMVPVTQDDVAPHITHDDDIDKLSKEVSLMSTSDESSSIPSKSSFDKYLAAGFTQDKSAPVTAEGSSSNKQMVQTKTETNMVSHLETKKLTNNSNSSETDKHPDSDISDLTKKFSLMSPSGSSTESDLQIKSKMDKFRKVDVYGHTCGQTGSEFIVEIIYKGKPIKKGCISSGKCHIQGPGIMECGAKICSGETGVKHIPLPTKPTALELSEKDLAKFNQIMDAFKEGVIVECKTGDISITRLRHCKPSIICTSAYLPNPIEIGKQESKDVFDFLNDCVNSKDGAASDDPAVYITIGQDMPRYGKEKLANICLKIMPCLTLSHLGQITGPLDDNLIDETSDDMQTQMSSSTLRNVRFEHNGASSATTPRVPTLAAQIDTEKSDDMRLRDIIGQGK